MSETVNASKKTSKPFDKFSTSVAKATGSSAAFTIAILFIVIWGLSGPLFHFSDTWQLVINTATSVITFLMVFLIQQSQNKDTLALQLKLNELIASHHRASNRLIDIEDLTSDELTRLKQFYTELGELAEKDKDLYKSHSIEDAREIQEEKLARQSQKEQNKQ
jgi:low affinity Fe/Cu permease